MTSTESPAAVDVNHDAVDTTSSHSDESSSTATMESDQMLPVAAVCSNLDLYIQSFNYRFLGNILEDIYQLVSGHYVVISSCIDSKYNCGYVTRFESLENIPAVASLYINPGFGPCSSLAVTKGSLLICGFDSGNILALGDEKLDIIENHRFFHNVITTIRLNGSESKLVAADFDGRITVIDTETFDPLKIFDYAHDGPVNAVQFHPKNDSVFLSTGGDNEILLWDLRAAPGTPPATAQLSCSTQATALYWPSDNEIIFGTEAGNVVRYDLRAQKSRTIQPLFAEKSIHRIVPLNSNRSLAIIANDANQVLFYDTALATCKHRQQYDKNVEIRSLLQVQPPETDAPILVAIGSEQSIFQHDDILDRL